MRSRIGHREIAIYLVPIITFTVIFFVFPLIFTITVSLVEWDGLTKMKFVGINNFSRLWDDPFFRKALLNTLSWIAVATFIHTPLGLLVALILSKCPRGWTFFRNIIFLPNVLSVVAIAIIWYFILHPTLGLVNYFLEFIGLGSLARNWLVDSHTALFATQLPFALYIGFTMLIFLAQIVTIPKDYYEAAKIDGAGTWQQDIYITLPLIKRALAVNILFNVAFCLRMVEYPMVMTSGGPGGMTSTLPLYMYYQMTRARAYGLSMAVGFINLCLGILVVTIVFKLLRSSGEE